MTTRPTVEPAGVSPMRIDVEPSSLYITHICDGEEVVRGGEDGQVYIATFCSYYMAHFFVGQCNQLAGFVSGTIAPTSQPSRGKCERCGGAKRIEQMPAPKAMKDKSSPSASYWIDCPDCAQPSPPCTCHPDDNPPRPCPRKYALSECRAAAQPERWGAKCDHMGCMIKTHTGATTGDCTRCGETFVLPTLAKFTSPPHADIVAPLHERIQGVYTRAGRAAVCGIPDDSHDCDQMACSSVEHILARVPHIVDEKPSPPPTDDIVAGLRQLIAPNAHPTIASTPFGFDVISRAIAALGEKGAA